MTHALYLDGRSDTARPVAVDVSVDAAGRRMLRFTGPGVDETWPVRSVRRVPPYDGPEARLQLASSDARLVIRLDEAASLQAACPELFRKSGLSGPVALLAALAIMAALVVGSVFFLAPMLAGPIARATPLEVERAYGLASREMIDRTTQPCAVPEPALSEARRLAADMARAAASPFETDLQFVTAGFPNAFALPGGRIVVTGELIALLESPDELAGVLAHETAHVAERHVMEALVRELGAAVILDLLVSGGAGHQIALAGLQIQSLEYGRAAETEADALAVRYLREIGVDPMGLAAFFDRLGKEEQANGAGGRDRMVELFSTHPLTARRAEAARALAAETGGPASPRPALSEATWRALKDSCKG
jgi:predicted Zn-dependent protease